MKNRFASFAVITAMFISSCGGGASTEPETTNTSAKESKQVDAEESTTVNGVEMKIIPGLTAVDVHQSMEKIGFTTEKNIGATICSWTSVMADNEGDYKVVVTGSGPEKLTSIDARYSASSTINGPKAGQFMEYVSTVPYQGATPQVAQAWVGRHSNTGGDTLIYGVKFRITARDNSNRALYINVPD